MIRHPGQKGIIKSLGKGVRPSYALEALSIKVEKEEAKSVNITYGHLQTKYCT